MNPLPFKRLVGVFIIGCTICASAISKPTQTEIESHIKEGNALFMQAHQITNGVQFNLETCSKAAPLLNSARQKLRAFSDQNTSFDYASLQLGRCLLVQQNYTEAAAAFKDVINLPITNRGTIIDEARILLADLYSQGLGVEQDKLKALGLYMMCEADAFDRKRKAAEIIIALNYKPTTAVYRLLEDDSFNPPKDMMRAYQLHKSRNMSEPFQGFFDNALSAASHYEDSEYAKAEQGTQVGIENAAAVKAIYAIFGKRALEKGELNKAMAYLNKANPQEVKDALQQLQQRIPYQLVELANQNLSELIVESKTNSKNKPTHSLQSDLNAALLATQLEKRLANGKLNPINNSRNLWMLEISIQDRTIFDAANVAHFFMISIDMPKAKQQSQGVIKPQISVIGSVDSINLSQTIRSNMPRQFLGKNLQPLKNYCIDPNGDNSQSKDNNDEKYPLIESTWQLKKLSHSHTVLIGNRSRFEGYAGGGAGATAEMLFDIRAGQLMPIACYGVSSYESIAGDWHNDGTREHDESHTNWTVKLKGQKAWPDIRLISDEKKPSYITLQWREKEQYYLIQAN